MNNNELKGICIYNRCKSEKELKQLQELNEKIKKKIREKNEDNIGGVFYKK